MIDEVLAYCKELEAVNGVLKRRLAMRGDGDYANEVGTVAEYLARITELEDEIAIKDRIILDQQARLGALDVEAIEGYALAVKGMSPEIRPLAETERDAIASAMLATGGHRKKASDLLQISVRTVRNKIFQYRGQEPDNELWARHDNQDDPDEGEADNVVALRQAT